MQVGLLKVPILIEVVKTEQKSDLILNPCICKKDEDGEELDAVDHTVCMCVPHGEDRLVNGKNLLELSKRNGERLRHELEPLVELLHTRDWLFENGFVCDWNRSWLQS